MRVYSNRFEFETRGEFDIVDLTSEVGSSVERSGIIEGIATVYSGHSTGAIILNEDDPALQEDLKNFLRGLVLTDGNYQHPENAFAHLHSILIWEIRVIPIHGGRLGLGRWQSLYWVETERCPRQRTIDVTVMGE